jgi:integrase
MASIVRRRGAKVWTAFYRDVHGKQHCRSTGAHDRKQAQKIADQYEDAASAQQTLRQAARVLADMQTLVGGEQLGKTSLRAYVTGWLEGKSSETKPATHYFYSQSCGKFLSFLGDRADAGIALITKAHISAYRAHLLPSLSGRTVNHHLTVIHMLFKSARRDGLIADDPSEFVGAVKQDTAGQKTGRRAFTVAELEAVLSIADLEWQSMILFGLYTGQRLMDIGRLTWANIDLERNELRLVAAKTGRRIILPLAAPLREHIEHLPSTDLPETHIHPRAAQAQKGVALSGEFAGLLVQAGLRERRAAAPKAERSTRRMQHELSFHSLRHTVVSMMHSAGVPQAVSETFAGHSSGAVHQLYIHTDRESLQRAADLLPVIHLRRG